MKKEASRLKSQLSEVVNVVEAAEAANAKVRSEADVALHAAAKRNTILLSTLYTAKKKEQSSAKEAEHVALELAAAVTAAEAAEAKTEDVRSKAQEAWQESADEQEALRAALSSAQEDEAGTASKLADLGKELLEVKANATAAAAAAAEAAKANIEAVREKARGDLQRAADKHEALRATCSSELVDSQREAAMKSDQLESELAEARKQLEDALESNDKTSIPGPETALEAAQTGERAQQVWLLDRTKVGVHGGQIGVQGQGGAASVRDSCLTNCPAVERVVVLSRRGRGLC